MIPQYLKTRVARKRTSSHALFFNERGEILIVKPIYMDHWLIPGGLIEEDESPLSACIREVKEEIGLTINVNRLLGVEYNPNKGEGGDGIAFVFYGGILKDEHIAAIQLQEEEIAEFKFVQPDNLGMLLPRLQKRIPRCIESARGLHVSYLEAGVMVF